MKQQMRKLGHLEHRGTPIQTGDEDDDGIGYSAVAGPSHEQEDEDIIKASITIWASHMAGKNSTTEPPYSMHFSEPLSISTTVSACPITSSPGLFLAILFILIALQKYIVVLYVSNRGSEYSSPKV